ncbi:MAG: PH domain-containing protein [Thermoplasmata archaeon]|nr:MAG: PH domain-containing protein [Thermoplasmata archaeon]
MEEEKWLQLHPNAKIALIIKPIIGVSFFIIFLVLPWLAMILSGDVPLDIFFLVLVLIIILLVSIIITWAIMFYNRYLFRIGGDAVYINRGILWKRNVVIPYERIQHTSMTRGPIDMLLGLHILNIFTAGTGSVGARFGGAASAFAAEGSIPGLSDPKPFQEAIMSKVHRLRGNGLGMVMPGAYVPKAEGAGSPSASSGTPSMAIPVSDTQDEMLKELRRIREILEKERR